jgi:hypothetical protein
VEHWQTTGKQQANNRQTTGKQQANNRQRHPRESGDLVAESLLYK